MTTYVGYIAITVLIVLSIFCCYVLFHKPIYDLYDARNERKSWWWVSIFSIFFITFMVIIANLVFILIIHGNG
jgi:hypothetical protein